MLFNPLKKTYWKTNLRILLVLPFVCQILAGLGIVGYLSYRNGQYALQEMTIKLRKEIGLRIDSHLDQFISSGNNLNQINQHNLIINPLLLKDLTRLGTYFVYQYQWNKQVNLIAFASNEGNYVEVLRTPLGELELTIFEQNKSNALLTYKVNSEGKITELLRTKIISDYDPRQESWYQNTLINNEYYWHQTQKEISSNTAVFINSRKVSDSQGNILGVVKNNTNLIELSNFLTSLKIGKSILIN